jgi:hypothetical protein
MSNTSSNKRSGWRVVKQFSGNAKFNLPKVLVTSIYGHEDMLDYLSDYRTQDKMRGVHYYPKGALCWFETNQYGDPTGSVYIARMIPDENQWKIPKRQRGLKRLLNQQNRKYSLKEKLTRERADTEIITVVKPKLSQRKG